MALLEHLLIDRVKSSAGTSAIEQATDVMRAFMMSRKPMKSFRYVYNEAEYQPATTEGGYVAIAMAAIAGAADLSAAKKRILKKFFCTCPVLIPSAFSVQCIITGWRITGLYPFGLRAILQQCSASPSDADYAHFLTALHHCPRSSGTRWTTAPVTSSSSPSTASCSPRASGRYRTEAMPLVEPPAGEPPAGACRTRGLPRGQGGRRSRVRAKRQVKAVKDAEKNRVGAWTDAERAAEAKVVADAKAEAKAVRDGAKQAEAQEKSKAKKADAQAKKAEDAAEKGEGEGGGGGGGSVARGAPLPAKRKAVVVSLTAEGWLMCNRCPTHEARGWFCDLDACKAMLTAHENVCTQ
jgi:hypothetical protein